MRVLVVSRYKERLKEKVAPFVAEQVDVLKSRGVEFRLFRVRGKGVKGYLGQLKSLKEQIKAFNPDLIHAHYGLCGLLACLQGKVPVVVTYHGSDINDPKVFPFSRIAMRLSAWDIFVSRKIMEKAHPKRNYTLLPCGVGLTDLQLTTRVEARRHLGLDQDKRYILFSSAFDNAVKNAPLAIKSIEALGAEEVELLELKGYTREEVSLLMCASDALLLTSHTEGSPQVVKEAMACGCPIVSVDVGDVRERVDGVEGCFVAQTGNPEELASLLRKALALESRTQGRKKIIADGLDNEHVAEKLIEIYGNTIVRR